MKRYILFLSCVLLQGAVAFAQNNGILTREDSKSFRENLKRLDEEVIQQNKLIDKIVSDRNLVKSYFLETGEFVQLVGVDLRGEPIYYITHNRKAALSANISAVQNSFDLDLSGQNMIVGMVDAAVIYNKHQEFEGNKNIILQSEDVNQSESISVKRNYQISQQHGTHVGGTLVAKGIDANAKGVIPQATLWSYDWKKDIRDMYYAANHGLLISNHSYGVNPIDFLGNLVIDRRLVGVYEKKAADFDYLVDNSKYYQPVISAGNYHEYASLFHPNGGQYNNLFGMATSKNAIVVGAAEDIVGNSDINDLKIARFSSYGPTVDFRIKPDIIANGVGFYSTINDFLRREDYVLDNTLYGYKSGTSMATPLVTGAITIWQQFAKENIGILLWSSSLRALLVQSARVNDQMITVNRADSKGDNINYLHAPHAAYGWGLLDVAKGIEILKETSNDLTYLIEDILVEGNLRVYTFENESSDNTLALTLAWTDPPGRYDYNLIQSGIVTKALVNDLDIRVKVGNQTYYPWLLKKDMNNPVAIVGDNDVDNIERIVIPNLPKGDVTIEISNKGILLNGRQNFSLILSTKEKIKVKYINNIYDDIFKKWDESPEDTSNFITFWPNPVVDVLNLTYEANVQIFELDFFDYTGKRIRSFKNVADTEIDLSDISAGMYIVLAKTNKGNIDYRLLKK